MGSNFSHVVGYGNTKWESFQNFKTCFVFHFGTYALIEYIKITFVKS